MKKYHLVFLFLILLIYNFTGCRPIIEVYVESELKPVDGFDQTDIQAVAVLNFDASAVHEKGVDNIALRDAIGYDIIRALYEQRKVRVIQGQAVEAVQERETIQSTVGDYEAATSTIERIVTYRYNPYQKVDAILSGKVLKYEILDRKRLAYSFIELEIRLVDSIDGTMYWITKIRGNYKDVIYTITHTISEKVYSEPAITITTMESLPSPIGSH